MGDLNTSYVNLTFLVHKCNVRICFFNGFLDRCDLYDFYYLYALYDLYDLYDSDDLYDCVDVHVLHRIQYIIWDSRNYMELYDICVASLQYL